MIATQFPDKCPALVAVFGEDIDGGRIDYLWDNGMDIAEVRVDLLADQAAFGVKETLLMFDGIPVISTIRSSKEGGQFTGSEAERLALFNAIMASTTAVDIELSSTDIIDEVIKTAKQLQKHVIVSFHDFDKTPDFDSLCQTIDNGFKKGADSVKVAAMINSFNDINNLSKLLFEYPDRSLTIIGMGEEGQSTRVIFPALGSRLMYCAAEKSTAPGQMNVEEMQDAMDKAGKS